MKYTIKKPILQYDSSPFLNSDDKLSFYRLYIGMCVNGCRNVSFGSGSLQLRQLDKLNRQFCLEMKDIPSSTKLDFKFDTKYKNYTGRVFSQETYLEKSKNIYKRITKLREDFNKIFTFNEDKNYKLLNDLIKKHKGANCRELVELMRYKLLEKGIECQKVGMFVKSKDYTKQRMASDHMFLVVNMKKNAKFENPSTWGSQAIIVDPWAQTVSYAHEGIKKMETSFGLDKSFEYFSFFRIF